MRTTVSEARITPRTATSGADADVAITLAADEMQAHVLHQVQWGYLGTLDATSAALTVTINSVVVFTVNITSNTGSLEFTSPIYGKKNQAMVITLVAGGTSVIGSLNAQTS